MPAPGRRAQSLVELAFSLCILTALMAFTIDLSVLALAALQLQSSVTASAMAASSAARNGEDPVAAAQAFGAANPNVKRDGTVLERGTVRGKVERLAGAWQAIDRNS